MSTENEPSILIGTVEHVCAMYDDDTGHGMTLCEQPIGGMDTGPRFEEPTCLKCREILEKNRRHVS